MTRKKRCYSSAYDSIYAFCNYDSYEAYSSNIICYKWGELRSPTCYSYGTHYPLIIKLGTIYLVNDSGYSNTTAKHINKAKNILSNKKTINIKTYFLESGAHDSVLSDCMEYIGKYKRARKYKDYYLNIATSLYHDYENFCRVTLKKPLYPIEFDINYIKKVSNYLIKLYDNKQLKKKKAECEKIACQLKIEREKNNKSEVK